MPHLHMSFRTGHVDIVAANTAYPVNVPVGTTRGLIRARNDGTDHDLHIADNAVKLLVTGEYFTIPGGQAYYEKDLNFNKPYTFYVASPDASVVMEFIWWGEWGN